MPNEQSGAGTPENPWRAGTQTGEQAITLPKSILKSSIKRNPPYEADSTAGASLRLSLWEGW